MILSQYNKINTTLLYITYFCIKMWLNLIVNDIGILFVRIVCARVVRVCVCGCVRSVQERTIVLRCISWQNSTYFWICSFASTALYIFSGVKFLSWDPSFCAEQRAVAVTPKHNVNTRTPIFSA